MAEYYVAWWNVENLFDVENSQQRPAYLQKQLAKELKGWNETILKKKVKQLASIITQMNQGAGPDLLGVCEVENKPVIERLVDAIEIPGRNYIVAHHDTKDQRGIDVAFLYDGNRLKPKEQFFHVILKRTATRDIFQVNFATKPGNKELIAIGNHWPSRRGGQYESEPYRIVAAETLAYWHVRIREIKGEEAAILALGDFNDEPHNRSMTDYALSTRSKKKVSQAKEAPRFLNLMWPVMGSGVATHYYENFPNLLDQFLVSKGLVGAGKPLSVKEESVEILRFPEMTKGTYSAPRRFGRPSAGLDEQGYSDHFPIGVVLAEA